MKHLLLLLFVSCAMPSWGQITIDTTRTSVTVKEKTAAVVRTLTIYRSFVQGAGMRNQAVYQPTASEFGEEPETLKLTFAEEMPHIKKMLDAAIAKKSFYFSTFSINVLPYTDMLEKLVEIYSASPEWIEYTKKETNTKRTTTLFDGSEITEVAYNPKAAAAVLKKSNFLKDLNALFAPYGYVVAADFPEPDEHQKVLSLDKLMLLGKDGNLFVPVPDYSFTLTKIRK
jgi:hypothetical protein